ncbi:hypothetical protein EJ07DRAFT_151356 [Lizonia empirigonia]|nr:hypothetical protein EJ07DRAFT_151356 [Lizonia empirigonia]
MRLSWAVRDELGRAHELQNCDVRMGAGCLPPVLEGEGVNGSSICNNNHDNDRRKARNDEASAVDVAGSINPQVHPGFVDYSSHLDSWHGQLRAVDSIFARLTTPPRCRRFLRLAARAEPHHQQARLISTVNGCQHITLQPHGLQHTIRARIPRTVPYCLTNNAPSATGRQHTSRCCHHFELCALQRHSGPSETQLTIHWMKTIALGYIDHPNTSKSTVKLSSGICQTSLGVARSKSKPVKFALASVCLSINQGRRP